MQDRLSILETLVQKRKTRLKSKYGVYNIHIRTCSIANTYVHML